MLIRLNLGLYSWLCALKLCSFGGSMVRALDYVWDAQMAWVRALAVHFWFFSKICIVFYYLKLFRLGIQIQNSILDLNLAHST